MDIEDILNLMQEIWASRPEGEQSGLSRDSVQWSDLCDVSRCLGARSLSALCRRFAQDYRYTTAGFPDLTLWNIRFVEVKSDTDKPSLKQIQWMHYLQQNGIDTEFCYVGVHTMRKKARAQ
ncbi:unnamed protein product [Diatraea saccharalis]|uniref:Fanconi-associated nuclease n=1 Tax=Diatraea saccharalis TaxID=40085 RepID=A0A9N9QZW5_9NEOP|nr:unnamed protein product [Diatraea saccharalis]CAG9795693.1 unnamed protein product [Diatraea saccharalis]